MPFQLNRGPAVIIAKEILRSAAGLDDIKSGVVDSTYVVQNPPSSGRYILEAGTVLSSSGPSAGRLKPVYEGDSVAQADVAGILGFTLEFWLGPGVTAGYATDEAVPVFHHGCDFNISKLVGYTGNETAIKAALKTCLFR